MFSLRKDLLEENAETHASGLRSRPVENKFSLVNQLEGRGRQGSGGAGQGGREVGVGKISRPFSFSNLLAPSDPLFEPWQRFNRSDKPLGQQFGLFAVGERLFHSTEIVQVEATWKFSHPADALALAAKGGCTLSELGIVGSAVGPGVTVYVAAYMMVNTSWGEGGAGRGALMREVRMNV